MRVSPPNMKPLSVAEAREHVLSVVGLLPEEKVALLEACGRPLSRPLTSDVDVAPFDNSAMDGFAIRSEDVASATPERPVVLRVVDEVAAGHCSAVRVRANEAVRIMTGAPVPAGADAVVKIEDTVAGPEGSFCCGSVAIPMPLPAGANIRKRGEDVRSGDEVLTAGDVLGPAAVGLAAATGNALVWVRRRPRVAILSTGDELVPPEEKPGAGKIRDANSPALAAQVIAAGGVPLSYEIVRDSAESVRAAFEKAADEADVIVSSGGVSVGDYDVVRDVLGELGELQFWRVAMRPGSPQAFGKYRGLPFFGLPGNPTSAYVGFELFVRPVLRKMQGFGALDRPVVRARLAAAVRKRPGRAHYLRSRLDRLDQPADGVCYEASFAGSQSSALLSTMRRANCLAVIPGDVSELPAGAVVDCVRLDVEEGTA